MTVLIGSYWSKIGEEEDHPYRLEKVILAVAEVALITDIL